MTTRVKAAVAAAVLVAAVARASANRTSGAAPVTVNFSSAGSSDPEGGALTYSWNFGDGNTSTAANPSHTFTGTGQRTVMLTVTDPVGRTGTATVVVTAGNTAPTVTLSTPFDGTLFNFGDAVPYTITVSDPEDGTIDCGRVKLTYLLGHDDHGHSITSRNGCSGTPQIPVDGEHDDAANLFAVFDAEYTDLGANGQPALTTHTQHVLQPRHRQAEHRGTQSGTGLLSTCNGAGGRTGPLEPTAPWSTRSRASAWMPTAGARPTVPQLIIWACHGGTNQRWTLP
jgi:PKD domain